METTMEEKMTIAIEKLIPKAQTQSEESSVIRNFKPECGTSGIWRIDSVVLTETDIALENMRMTMHGHGRRHLKPGTIYRLIRGNTTVMSNTPAEINEAWELFEYGTGHVLINGLGLGICEFKLLEKPDITKITVIENSQDVINLSGKMFKDEPRVEIILADCFTWQPPKGVIYDFVFHDIWDAICSDNLPEMAKLHRKYGKRCKRQASWAKRECESQKRIGGRW